VTIEEALKTHLANNAAVGELVIDRVYPVLLPPRAQMPAIAYQRIDTVHDAMTHDERSSSSLVRPRFQLNCYDDDYDGAHVLATAVRQALRGYSGLLGGLQQVAGCEVVTQQDNYDTETQRFRVIVDMQFRTLED